jgi:hypothetical protein
MLMIESKCTDEARYTTKCTSCCKKSSNAKGKTDAIALIDAMGKRVDAALRVAFAMVKEGTMGMVGIVALGLQLHSTEDLAVKVDRFRIGRVE